MKPDAVPEIDPKQAQRQSVQRMVGPVLLLGGLIFLVLGAMDFFKAIGTYGQQPRQLWCFFVALPLLWLGFVVTCAGFKRL